MRISSNVVKWRYIMKKAKRSITTTICVIVALGVFYLIACACIGNKKFFPNTSINGIDVSSMTVAQAAEEVKEQFRTEYSNASIDVTVKDKKYLSLIHILHLHPQPEYLS